MSTSSSLMRQVSVDYQEAQRAEAQEAWTVAASAYLKALTLEPQRCAGVVEDLERLTQRSADLRVRVIWGISLASQGRWDEAEAALAPLPDAPMNLSRTISQRWPQLKKKRGREGASLSTWVRSLRLIDRALSMGFAREAILLAEHVVHHISSPEKSALVLYEAGRLGILHRQVSLGVRVMRRAIEVKEILRERARKLVDEALTEQRAEGDELEELLELRIKRVQDLGRWANQLVDSTPPSQRVELALLFASHIEHGLRRPDVATHFYTEAIVSSLQGKAQEAHTLSELSRACIDALVRLSLQGSTDAERGLKDVYARTGHIDPLDRYLNELSFDSSQNSTRRGHAAHERAHHLSTEGRYEEGVEAVTLAAQLSPEIVDLRAMIKQARRAKAWGPLDRLLSLQLNTTRSVKKQQAILIAQAQTRQARGMNAAAYLALVGAQSLGEAPKADEMMRALLHDERGRQKISSWLLREGAEELSGWVDDCLHYVELTRRLGPTLSLGPQGDEADSTTSINSEDETPDGSTADEEAELFIFDFDRSEAEQDEPASLTQPQLSQDPIGSFLSSALRSAPQEWALASALLNHLEARGQWEDWVEWVMTSPKTRWPDPERDLLIQRAVELSRTHKTSQLSNLLKDIAVSLDRSGAEGEKRLEAWGAYLDEHPADRHALEHFTELAREREAWSELAARYEAALEARQTGKIHLLELLAELYEERLLDPEQASVSWRKLLSIKANHARAGLWLSLYLSSQRRWRELAALCLEEWRPDEGEQGTWRESLLQAYLGLEMIHEAMETWERLSEERTQKLYVPSLLALAERAQHGPAVLTLLEADLDMRRDEEGYGSLNELETASQSEDELIDESLPPMLPSEEELLRHDQSLAGIESISEHFSREADELRRALEARPKVPHHLRLKAQALTYMSPQLDSLSAINAWREVRQFDARDAEATLALTELYAATGRREELDQIVDYAERWCGVDEGMRRALTQGALSYEARFADYSEAFRCWSVLLERAPQHAKRCLHALERLAAQGELWSQLDERWVKYAERSAKLTERSRALLAQTELCAGPLHHWHIALELLPPLEERRPYCQTIRRLYSEVIPPLRKWDVLAERWLKWAEQMRVGPARAERVAMVAELFETRLEAPERALELYQLASEMSAQLRAQELAQDVERLSARLSARERPQAQPKPRPPAPPTSEQRASPVAPLPPLPPEPELQAIGSSTLSGGPPKPPPLPEPSS